MDTHTVLFTMGGAAFASLMHWIVRDVNRAEVLRLTQEVKDYQSLMDSLSNRIKGLTVKALAWDHHMEDHYLLEDIERELDGKG